jgi:5-methylcytosine-specific restriction endonuclease McrA
MPAKWQNRRARKRHASGTHTAADIAAQRTRQKGRCFWCQEKVGRSYHVDHVMPISRGGSNGPENIVIACASCNLSKGAKMPSEFGGRLC